MNLLKKKDSIFRLTMVSIAFFLLFLSFSGNLWHVADSGVLNGFDKEDEGLVIGRIEKSARDGVFSEGGFPCAYTTFPNTKSIRDNRNIQLDNFVNDIPNQGQLTLYKSQSGGQGIFYSIIHKVLPFSNLTVFYIFRVLNALLTALCFVLFICWTYRNYTLIPAIVAFVLLLLSPGLVLFGHNLWWALWSFYIPFLAMLLSFEKRQRYPLKITYTEIYAILFVAVFVKCIFTGFEYITTTLVAAICPIIYYLIIDNQKMGSAFNIVFKAGVCALLGVVAEMLVLLAQFKILAGSFMAGFDHIVFSFSKSSTMGRGMNEAPQLDEILRTYFTTDNMLQTYIPGVNIRSYVLIGVISLFCIIIYYLSRKCVDTNQRRNNSLIATTLFSSLAPLSWYIIFQEHATMHPFFDYIVLYMPFFLFGFLAIGEGLRLIIICLATKQQK